jgi:hypothetical protein
MELMYEKIKNIIKKTVELPQSYNDDIHKINCFKMFMNVKHENIYKMMNFNICSFNYEYEGYKSVLLIFSTSINDKDTTKDTTNKIINVIDILEKSLITLDYIESKEIKEDNQIYLIVVKKLKKLEVFNESNSINK